MIKGLAYNIAKRITEINGKFEDIEVYIYGLQIIIDTIIGILSVVVLGYMFGQGKSSIFYLICYCSVRVFAGGYHANTNEKCAIMFIMGYCVCTFIIFSIETINTSMLISVLTIVNIIVYLFSPVEAPNNPIPFSKKKK